MCIRDRCIAQLRRKTAKTIRTTRPRWAHPRAFIRPSRPMNGTMTTKRNTGTTITLGRLVDAVGPLVVTPLDETARTLEITGVTVDSRAVRGGELFVAVRGSAVDGHRFVRDALERGAAAVIIESGAPPVGAPFVVCLLYTSDA